MNPDRGVVKFLARGGQSLGVEPTEYHLNLLGHAQCLELELGSQCGGHGKCGKDRVLVQNQTALVNSPTEAEHRLLSAEDLARGVRLACQCFPNENGCSIEVLVES